jgi:hypothetical protein
LTVSIAFEIDRFLCFLGVSRLPERRVKACHHRKRPKLHICHGLQGGPSLGCGCRGKAS